jgi:hypothetical protein
MILLRSLTHSQIHKMRHPFYPWQQLCAKHRAGAGWGPWLCSAVGWLKHQALWTLQGGEDGARLKARRGDPEAEHLSSRMALVDC